jgi:Flp pilus assembly protein TadG
MGQRRTRSRERIRTTGWRLAKLERAHPPRSRGQSLVEFTLVSGLLLVLFATAFDFGRVFYAQISIASASRAGALQAAVTPGAFTGADCASYSKPNAVICAVQREVAGSPSWLVTVRRSDIVVTCEDTAGTSVSCAADPQTGIRSRVGVTGSMTLMTPVLRALLGSTVAIGAGAAADQQALPTAIP